MLKWKRFNKRETQLTVFVKLLASYLIVLLIPVIIGIVLFNRIESSMIENAHKSNTAMLEQVRIVLDNRFEEVEQLSLQISLNQKLNHLMTTQRKASNYEYIDFIKELRQYRTVSTNIDDFYVYFSQSDVLLSPRMKTDSKLFFNHIKQYKDSSYNEVMTNKMSGFHSKEYFPSEKVIMISGEKNVITLIQSLPYGEVRDVRGVLMVHIDEKQIRNMLQQLEGLNQGVMYIADQKKEIMMSTNANEEDFEEIQSLLNKKEGSFEQEINGTAMVASYLTSEKNGWTYVSLFPKAFVLSKVNQVKSLAFVLLIIAIVLGMVVSYYLANRNYRPIREMVRTVIGNERPKGEFTNELDLIKETIVHSIHKQSQLKQIVSQQEPVIRANFLLRLIRGQVDLMTISKKELASMGVNFKGNYYSAIVIQIDDYCPFTTENIDTKWVLTRFIITNLSDEILDGNGYTIEVERDKLIILNNHLDPKEIVNDSSVNSVKKLKDILEQQFSMKITVAISQTHYGLNKVSECYGEAMMALDFRVIKGPGSIIFYHDIKDKTSYHYHFPMEAEVQILNFAKNGDFVNVKKLLDQIFNNNVQQEMTPEISKCLAYDLLSTWVKLLSILSAEDKKSFIDRKQPFKIISESNTLEELQQKIKSLYFEFCDKMQENQSNQGERLYKEITHFIEENYHKNVLGLGMIAEHFAMNSSYLSSFFKKQSGMTLSEFITTVRIEESKKMLSNRKLTISEIATKVGYANSVGLIRVFKKVEGVTPGQYREIM
ncbi:AraC family transcriptional regulator [Gracilibacillus sp. S3-1-1]|uniref:AraC family transcriptional regulator n=1 Tax=Gracilibacillus pellucidus TaxID=3095368 RepID=A0ACC6M3S9_9BACI|nr:AraC family transcriptional regulator [Gracilibacillus sp. S3-1-1]MDX8045541.1 AraC family transcriptional regulator [Gracilibacillus sp. S3-1-1]